MTPTHVQEAYPMTDTSDTTSESGTEAEATTEEPQAGTEKAAETEAEAKVEQEAEKPAEETTEEPKEGEDEDSKLDLDGAKKALSKVRQEAAKSRTKLRDLETQLQDAKTPEQVKAIVDELTSTNATETRNLLVENVALKAGLPEDAFDRLKGETREELEADAKALAKLLGTKAVADPDVSGGLSPEGDPEVFDVEAARAAARKARRSR